MITLRDDAVVVLYQLHPANDTSVESLAEIHGANPRGLQTVLLFLFLFFSRAKATRSAMEEEEKRFPFPSRDTISRALIRHVTTRGREAKALESDFII